MKLKKITLPSEERFYFMCPGCKMVHSYRVGHDGQRPSWEFNGDMEKPTFVPSLLMPDLRCHLYLTNGMIEFLGDCSHSLAGKVVPMLEYREDWL